LCHKSQLLDAQKGIKGSSTQIFEQSMSRYSGLPKSSKHHGIWMHSGIPVNGIGAVKRNDLVAKTQPGIDPSTGINFSGNQEHCYNRVAHVNSSFFL
jgi:hypothetical protein